ncbi:MAG: hypothetical protein ACYTFW_18915 [Planctomycetota bacterium]|jgi:hypothetical protein
MTDTPTLYTQDDTGAYVEFTPPSPPTFHETLPEDIRGNESLKDIQDSGQLAQKYLEVSTKVPVVPGEPEGYAFEFPEGFDASEEDVAGFRQIAFEAGLTQDQYAKALSFQVAREQRIAEQVKADVDQNRQTSEESLKKEWGDNYEPNLEIAKRVFNKFTDEASKQFIEQSRFGDNPAVIKLFHNIGKVLSEDILQTGSHKSTPEQRLDEAGRPMLIFPSMENK